MFNDIFFAPRTGANRKTILRTTIAIAVVALFLVSSLVVLIPSDGSAAKEANSAANDEDSKFKVDGLIYHDIGEDKVELIGVDDIPSTDLVIPKTIEIPDPYSETPVTYTVTRIETWNAIAWHDEITSITLPNTLDPDVIMSGETFEGCTSLR